MPRMKCEKHLSLATIAKIILSMKKNTPEDSFFLGITGASGAGKTTLSLDLQKEFQRQCPEWCITVIQADNFIYPNAILEAKHLMQRKGFPESFDAQALKKCLQALKKNTVCPIEMPCYSQDIKDIMPGKVLAIEKSHIYLIEGVNLFFKYEHYENFHAVNYLDFCIYLDTDRELVKARALKRFFDAYERSKKQPTPYFEQFSGWPEQRIQEHAEKLWETMDMELLKVYIEPHQSMANLVLKSYT